MRKTNKVVVVMGKWKHFMYVFGRVAKSSHKIAEQKCGDTLVGKKLMDWTEDPK